MSLKVKNFIKDWHSELHNLIVVLAIVIGSVWAIYKFVITTSPAVVLKTTATTIEQKDGRTLLRLRVDIQNKGSAIKTYNKGSFLFIKVNNIVPDSLSIIKLPDGSLNYPEYNKDGGIFEPLEVINQPFDTRVVVRPGDEESFFFNFLLKKDVTAISIYVSPREKSKRVLEKGHYAIFELSSNSSYELVKQQQRQKQELNRLEPKHVTPQKIESRQIELKQIEPKRVIPMELESKQLEKKTQKRQRRKHRKADKQAQQEMPEKGNKQDQQEY